MPMPGPTETSLTRIVQAVRELWQGRSNAYGQVTLAVSPATSTAVTAVNCGERSFPALTPLTANAAAALSGCYITGINNGGFTINHAASAQTDRTFGYTIGS